MKTTSVKEYRAMCKGPKGRAIFISTDIAFVRSMVRSLGTAGWPSIIYQRHVGDRWIVFDPTETAGTGKTNGRKPTGAKRPRTVGAK